MEQGSVSFFMWAAMLGIVSFALTALVMPRLIQYLHKLKFGQTERAEGLASHQSKTGTPTMGGMAFIVVPLVIYAVFSCFMPGLWNLNAAIVWIAFIGYGLIGFIDDYLIVVKKDNAGLSAKMKFGLQAVLAIIIFLMYHSSNSTAILIPGVGMSIDLGWFYFLIVFFMFTGSSNAVNLTDGVDGLCAGLCTIALIPFAFFCVWQQQYNLLCLILAVIGGLLGYLIYNIHPAKIFMGDTGSLALGGLLAALAMVTKMELVFIIVAGVFIAETLSVMIQVTVYRKTKKRVFRMAPLHHHFEKGGWSENKVVLVFWAWGLAFALLGLWIGSLA